MFSLKKENCKQLIEKKLSFYIFPTIFFFNEESLGIFFFQMSPSFNKRFNEENFLFGCFCLLANISNSKQSVECFPLTIALFSILEKMLFVSYDQPFMDAMVLHNIFKFKEFEEQKAEI